MSDTKKTPFNIYAPQSTIDTLDDLRADHAKRAKVANCSRGDYIAILVEKDAEEKQLENFGCNQPS